MKQYESYNEKYPFGKKATVVTADNIQASQDALSARRRVEKGQALPGDRELLSGREDSIRRVQEQLDSQS